jgi:hypothetical protein
VAGLTAAELSRIGGRLEAFADDLFASLPRADQRARGRCSLRGLLLEGRRRSIEPMAQRLGEVHDQALHHLVAVSPWDWRPVRRRLAEVLTAALSPTAWVVDDTGFPKDGTPSVGVQRQDSGTLGKTATCQPGCRSTRAPSTPAVRWTGGCSSPSAGASRRWPRGVRPAGGPRACTTGPSGIWCWTCWRSWSSGAWPAGAAGRRRRWEVGGSAPAWTPARSPRWWRSGPAPAPPPSRCARPSPPPRAVAAVPACATATSHPRCTNSPSKWGSRPAWSWSGGVAARGGNAAACCACGSARPGSPTPVGTSGRRRAAGALAAGRMAPGQA